jgi:alanyl-tRNA synthetase
MHHSQLTARYMTSSEIRNEFLDFFKSKGHVVVPSAPIVVKDDPTLMFTNAGMNQFKDYFLGNKKPIHRRVADTQKCLRVSGKHNDLEEVGVDTFHHTMFEMLGNWSFGDYFKKEAIEWSWQLLTEIYKIPTDRLYVTVFGGDENEKLPKDEEVINEWKKWMAEDRILLFGRKDNFWEMGDTGPCGPCTEIHIDCRPDEERIKIDAKKLVNDDNPQVIEIWNNVFIQFNRLKDGRLEPLPQKHVDTGMGFERLTRVLQNKDSNYDTDIFRGTIEATQDKTGKKYGNTVSRQDVAFRVIADHVRAIAFTIADGQLPSNTGAGYVIRRILRRAVRYYFSYLDYKQPLLCQLMPLLAHQFENVFPELQKQIDFVTKVVKEEEEAFLRTLDKGLKRIEEIVRSASGRQIAGKDAFELYDTYGFPIDLTRLIAAENNIAVDEKGFEKEMEQQKSRSRAATAIDVEDWVVLSETAQNAFVGYDTLETETRVIKYRKMKAKGKEAFQLVLEATPFYAESGGQVGDTGELVFNSPLTGGKGRGERIKVNDTKKENELIIHFVDGIPSDLTGKVVAKVDATMRRNTAWHHTATHLLHAALRKVLGTHVIQKGSLVNSEHLRFDFAHFAKMTDQEIAEVEELVNEKIRNNIPVVIKLMPREEAMKLGAMALFGEKYGDVVRVVIIDPTYSMELCGGTHVGATGDIGLFKITNETAVAAGVRRIEAVCGRLAEDYVNQEFRLINSIRDSLKNPKDVLKAVENISNENAELKKKLEKLEAQQLETIKQELLKKTVQLNGTTFIGEVVEVGSADALKKLCFDLKNELSSHRGMSYAVVLATNIEGKAQVAILLDEQLAMSKSLEAPKIIKEHIAPLIKGGGGGQKTLATAGGQDASNLKLVIEKVKGLL